MSRSPGDYLRHFHDEAEYLMEKSVALSKEAFLRDDMLRRAFVRSPEVIGEATKNLPWESRQQHSHIDWRAIAETQDRLIHGYFGVDYDIVWWSCIRFRSCASLYTISSSLTRRISGSTSRCARRDRPQFGKR